MNPALSVIFLTTLIGTGQGLFLVLYGIESVGALQSASAGRSLLLIGGAVSVLLTGLGLVASFFHLGRPERFWRTATMWRTSWLSREVIALSAFLAGLCMWTLMQGLGHDGTRVAGAFTALAGLALFVCTAMVYASVRFLQEWASAYTVVNFSLLGMASGLMLATSLAARVAPGLVAVLAWTAAGTTLAGGISRTLSLRRNDRLRPRSTLQSALGIRHPQIRQIAMGFMGGSFNTREFFHGRAPGSLRRVRTVFQLLCFVLPLPLLWAGVSLGSAGLLALAFIVQYLGLLAERWYFLAQARHPQNLYYQTVS